jgi:hypothetical protein
LMCFDRNINGNRDVTILECDYLLVQRCVKLTLLRAQFLGLYRIVLGPFFFNHSVSIAD